MQSELNRSAMDTGSASGRIETMANDIDAEAGRLRAALGCFQASLKEA